VNAAKTAPPAATDRRNFKGKSDIVTSRIFSAVFEAQDHSLTARHHNRVCANLEPCAIRGAAPMFEALMPSRRQLLAASAMLLAGRDAWWPSRLAAQVLAKPARIVVGFAAGGGTDVTARLLAEALRGAYAATVIVDNRPGAAARAALEYVKNAEGDGSVMLFTPDFPITVYPYSFRSLNYDPVKDFTAVTPLTRSMLTYNIGPAVPAGVASLRDFVEWCRAHPDKATYATTAAGGTPHFVGVMVANAAAVPITPVHYRGGAPALADLLGGHVSASVNPVSEVLPFAKSGTLRTLAVTGSRRSRFLPDILTMREAGYDVVLDSWSGMFLPAGAPPSIVNALSAALGEAIRSAKLADSIVRSGNEPTFQMPAEFAATVAADLARWGPIVKASGFVAED
jgi:tripartite-type tricarboxylate transporter receptor subunit TctC